MDQNIEAYKFIASLKQLPFVDEIWLFGSRARGDHSDRSDIDLALVCPSATSYDWSKVLEVIDNADTLLKIDCLRFDELAEDDRLRENILRFKKVIYKR
ncbi:MAG: Nucleotidyltransferase domain [Candidatus Midichloriaceae bacterium]|jgi:predicted nucleotidyltransferase|nr:Nucleotidyltransferase domain [Candidatus Midichloriaceae bacterium]